MARCEQMESGNNVRNIHYFYIFFSLIYGFQVIQCHTISILVLGKQHFLLQIILI